MATAGIPQFAKHPLTGAPIRIMTTEASIWRDQKTLAWLGPSDLKQVSEPARWNRWDVGVTSLAALTALKEAGVRVDVVICLGDDAAWADWLRAGKWSEAALVAIPKSIANLIGYEELMALKVGNMICVDEIHDLYPFVGAAWDGTEDDAKVLLALALHMGRTGPVAAAAITDTYRPLVEQGALRLESTLRPPPPLWLIQQYYQPDKARRRKEISACLQANAENPLIDRIILLDETACAPLATSPKLYEEVLGRRLTYADVFKWIAEDAPEDVICVFANSDIFLDAESMRLLWSVDLTKKFLALLRWDVEGTDAASRAAAKLFGPRADSQDTWIVSAAGVKATFKTAADYEGLNFPFGQGGCDNAITLELLRRRFTVANPALTLRTYHLHTSAVRNYDPRDIVSKPAYLYVQPTGLHDMRAEQLAVPRGATQVPFERRSFPRPVAGPLTPAQATTFCTMVARATGGAVKLQPDGPNLWPDAAAQAARPALFRTGGPVFQTPEGTSYEYDAIHVGRSKAGAEAWSASQLSSMSAALAVQRAAVAPLTDAVASDKGRYVLEYLAKVLILQGLAAADPRTVPNIPFEFWCSGKSGCIDVIKLFNWPFQNVPILSRDDTALTWCKEAFVWPYNDELAGYVSQEEIVALRGAVGSGGWVPTVEEGVRRLVVVVDGAVITEEVATALEAVAPVDILWEGRTSLQHAVGHLRGAAGMVLASGSSFSAWSWMLPLGAAIWEVQSEMKPSAALLHQAAAAELRHRLLITPKGALSAADRVTVAQKLVADARLLFGLTPVATAPNSVRPTLLMPKGHKGFFAHAGDSFREMALLWAQRGYVELIDSPLVSQIWLGAVGKTLLYDRPTMEWYNAAPDEEKGYELALFGNPAPPVGAAAGGATGKGKAVPWFFWPRKPNLVESLVALGVATNSYKARPDGLVFYGRSENAVQLGNRKKMDWSSAFTSPADKFVHVEGTAPYPFTHEEYLMNLSKARFGLCLAGYGRKCHREVECMAMGCVPIVAPEVDMTNYAEPPQLGVHYFRVATPAEAAAIVTSVSPTRWALMSAACREWWARNASVEGSWRLTQRLLTQA